MVDAPLKPRDKVMSATEVYGFSANPIPIRKKAGIICAVKYVKEKHKCQKNNIVNT